MTRKDKILKEALQLFAVQGVGNTSTAEITRKAGVAEGTLFVHFKNKQALVDAVYVSIKVREAKVFERAVQDKDTAEEFVRTLGKVVVEHFVKHYKEIIFIQNATLLNQVSGKTLLETSKHFEMLGNKLKGWQKRGDLKQIDIELLHQISWAALVALVHYCKQNKVKITDTLLDPIWDSVRA